MKIPQSSIDALKRLPLLTNLDWKEMAAGVVNRFGVPRPHDMRSEKQERKHGK